MVNIHASEDEILQSLSKFDKAKRVQKRTLALFAFKRFLCMLPKRLYWKLTLLKGTYTFEVKGERPEDTWWPDTMIWTGSSWYFPGRVYPETDLPFNMKSFFTQGV